MKILRRQGVILSALILLLLIILIISLAVGQVDIPVTALFSAMFGKLGFYGAEGGGLSPEQAAVLWHIRLPRMIIGVMVGAALAVSGAVMQGVFGNPLAEPGIIGVSGGAAFGAVLSIAFGLTAVSMYMMPLFALVGALTAVSITVFLAMRNGKIPAMVLLLAGVAVNILSGALTSGILTFMNEYKLKEFLFWTVGGLDYRRWEHIYLAMGPILIGTIILFFLARHLNILVLGEEEARAVDVPVVALRLILLFVATLTTSFAVCVSGSISFVGLVVPHVMRLLLGPEHRILLPACALAGAFFLVSCDTLGRVIIPPSEIRVGIMTALVGAPYFLYLLRRAHKGGGLS